MRKKRIQWLHDPSKNHRKISLNEDIAIMNSLLIQKKLILQEINN